MNRITKIKLKLQMVSKKDYGMLAKTIMLTKQRRTLDIQEKNNCKTLMTMISTDSKEKAIIKNKIKIFTAEMMMLMKRKQYLDHLKTGT